MKKLIYFLLTIVLAVNSLALMACDEPQGPQIPEYSITTSAEAGGTISASKTTAKQGDSVVFNLTANSGYIIEKLTVNGGEVTVNDEGEYVLQAVLGDINAKAYFLKSDAIVRFNANGATLDDKAVFYGQTFGALPTPTIIGKRFVGWEDENGNAVTETSIVRADGIITLNAVTKDITAEEITALKPHTITSSYYDQAATKYGVNWHVDVEPVAPVIKVTSVFNDNEPDFTNAREIACPYDVWNCGLGSKNPYVVTGVVDELNFNSRYAVTFGDKAANVWSDEYVFTTREEQLDEISFTYVADTQETYRIEQTAHSDISSKYIGDTYWSQLMGDAVTRFPDTDFVANGGDITNYGNFPIYWEEMLDSVNEYLFNLPIMPVAGNHAEVGWYSAGYWSFSKMFNIDAPIDKNIIGLYYSFDLGPLHFIALRSNDALYTGNGRKYGQAQIDWLIQDLESVDREVTPWVVVMHHEGVISAGYTAPGSNYHEDTVYPQLMPIFDNYDIDLVLFGHNHDHASTFPIKYDSEGEGYTNGLGVTRQVEIVTNETQKVEYDGVMIDEFVFEDGVTDKGTVLHQTGPAGYQWSGGKYIRRNIEENRQIYGEYYRELFKTGSGAWAKDDAQYEQVSNINLVCYTQFEISNDTLVGRSYGMDVQNKVKDHGLDPLASVNEYNAYTYFLEGFKLSK